MDTKVCSKCREKKSTKDFYKKSSTKDGLQYHCKACKTQYNQMHYLSNMDMYKAKQKRHQAINFDRNRMIVRNHLLLHPCIDCGEDNPVVLEFDHREQSQKSFTISQVLGWISGSLLINEIAKCDIRCANCHRMRTAKQLGWYAWMEDESVI